MLQQISPVDEICDDWARCAMYLSMQQFTRAPDGYRHLKYWSPTYNCDHIRTLANRIILTRFAESNTRGYNGKEKAV